MQYNQDFWSPTMTYADRMKEIEARVSDPCLDCGCIRTDAAFLLSRVKELEAALGEATNALMYIGDKAVVDWDGATVGEADAALAKLPETYKENYINFMRIAMKIWPLVIVGADMELNTITIDCEAGGVKMGETLGALFYRRLTAIKDGRK